MKCIVAVLMTLLGECFCQSTTKFKCNSDNEADCLRAQLSALQMQHETKNREFTSLKEKCHRHMDCADVFKSGFNRSGVYAIYPVESKILVYCDMDTSGGGWTVIQRRMDGSENFNRTYQQYADGFGDLRREFWLGNHHIAQLSSPESYRLRIDMERFNGQKAYAEYNYFHVGPASLKFRLTVGSYSGTAGNSLTWHNGMKFSAWDADNDAYSGGQCSHMYGDGGFWFRKCHAAFLNGKYSNVPTINYAMGVVWKGLTGYYESLHSFHEDKTNELHKLRESLK